MKISLDNAKKKKKKKKHYYHMLLLQYNSSIFSIKSDPKHYFWGQLVIVCCQSLYSLFDKTLAEIYGVKYAFYAP